MRQRRSTKSRNVSHNLVRQSDQPRHCQESSTTVTHGFSRSTAYYGPYESLYQCEEKYVTQTPMMSLPGLGLEEPEDTSYGQGSQSQNHDLNKDTEWRFEVAVGRSVNVKVVTGTAEMFGTELVVGRPYIFQSTKAAIYTWTGCTLEVSSDYGSLSSALPSEYIAEETPMNEYINTHFALEGLRENALRNNGQGPRILVLGPENAGKTSLCKILAAYAVRSGRSTVVVNTNPGEGVLSLPGTLTATVFKTLVEVEEGWGNAPMSGPNGEVPVKLPLVYYYGSMVPEERGGAVFKNQNTRLGLAVEGRLAQDSDARFGGVIVDTPASLGSSKGYDIVAHMVSEFGINCIVCLGSERLYSDMVKRFDNAPTTGNRAVPGDGQDKISVIKLSKSGGAADRDTIYKRATRDSQVRNYFYGNTQVGAGISLQPRQQQIDFDAITIWRRISPQGSSTSMATGASGGIDDEDSFLPGGSDDREDALPKQMTSAVPLPLSQIFERLTVPIPALRNCVLAVLNCEPEPSDNEQDVLRDSSVMGFLYVTDVDEARARISLLSPVAGRVPNRALVWAEGIDGVLGLT